MITKRQKILRLYLGRDSEKITEIMRNIKDMKDMKRLRTDHMPRSQKRGTSLKDTRKGRNHQRRRYSKIGKNRYQTLQTARLRKQVTIRTHCTQLDATFTETY